MWNTKLLSAKYLYVTRRTCLNISKEKKRCKIINYKKKIIECRKNTKINIKMKNPKLLFKLQTKNYEIFYISV